MNDLHVTYKLIKKIISLREELVAFARLSREKKLTEIHEKGMMNKAFEIDELLREIGIDWINDYEANLKIKSSIGK